MRSRGFPIGTPVPLFMLSKLGESQARKIETRVKEKKKRNLCFKMFLQK